jgi:hypothetical protein
MVDKDIEITMNLYNRSTGETIEMKDWYAETDSWHEVAYQVFRFLRAMGYELDAADVGVEF